MPKALTLIMVVNLIAADAWLRVSPTLMAMTDLPVSRRRFTER